MQRKATNRHVFLRVVSEVEVSRSKKFAETVTQYPARFADVYFSTYSTVYAVDKTSVNTREMISDSDSSVTSRNFVRVRAERTGPISYSCTFECAGVMIAFECTVD